MFRHLLFITHSFTSAFACSFASAFTGSFTSAFTSRRFKNTDILCIFCISVWILFCVLFNRIVSLFVCQFPCLSFLLLVWDRLFWWFGLWNFFIFTNLIRFFIHRLIEMSFTTFSTLALYLVAWNRLSEHQLFKIIKQF